jgi:hypothetical protein
MPRHRTIRRRTFISVALLCCTASLVRAETPVDIDQAVDAIWRVRSVTLHFQSPTTYYYCDILQQRVSDIMRAVGAGDPMSVQARCSVGALLNDTSVRIVAGVPIEATEANVQAETTFDSHTELVAQTRNWKLPTPTSVRRFRAIRTELSFARVDLHLSPSDCDLLQGMSEQVFPSFGIRTVMPLYCTPGSRPLSRPGLVVEALMPVKALSVARR